MTIMRSLAAGCEIPPLAGTCNGRSREDRSCKVESLLYRGTAAGGSPDADAVSRYRNFDLTLAAGIEKKVEPVKLLELANGYINGRMSKSQFLRAVEVLQKPVHERFGDMYALGIPRNRKIGLMAEDWAFIGLMNGVIDIKDFDLIDRIPFDLTNPVFWTKYFPRCVDEQGKVVHLPELQPHDWSHVGVFEMPSQNQVEGRNSGRTYFPITLELIHKGFCGYDSRLHYLTCIVARRLDVNPAGPLGGYRNAGDATEAFHELFQHDKNSAERHGFFPCRIV